MVAALFCGSRATRPLKKKTRGDHRPGAGGGGGAGGGRKEEAAGGGRRGRGAAAVVPRGGAAGARTSTAAGSPARHRGARLRRGARLAAAPNPDRRAGSAQSPLPDSRGPCTGCCSSPPPPLLRPPPPPLLRPPPPSSLPPLLRLAAVQLRAAPARLAVAQPLPAAPSPSRLTVRGRGFLAAPLAPVARRQAAARHHNGLDAGSPAALPPVPAPPAAGRLKGGER